MSIYLQTTTNPDGPDAGTLELKVHYIMKCLAEAGLLLDANGKPTFAGADVEADAAIVQATIVGNQ